jgi:hypothetical protein
VDVLVGVCQRQRGEHADILGGDELAAVEDDGAVIHRNRQRQVGADGEQRLALNGSEPRSTGLTCS